MGDTEENTGFSDQESDFDLSSCSLSSYEEGEHESSDSDCYYSESESVSGHGVIPYDHEPEYEEGENRPQNASSESEATPESEEASRLVDTSWCRCGHCQVLPKPRDCICCHEIPRVKDKMAAYDIDLQCITEHEGFQPLCCNQYVLEVAYYQYRQQYGHRPERGNARMRYTAYRQFVRWCWQYLGPEVRVILPACVVSTIRRTFPESTGNYKGFLWADETD